MFGLALHPDKTRLIEFGRFHGRAPIGEGLVEAENFRLPGLHAYGSR
jgi:hypothetical protein